MKPEDLADLDDLIRTERQQQDAARAAIERVRAVVVTGRRSSIGRVYDYVPAIDVLAALDTPTDTAGTMGDHYIHITYGPWDSSGHQCGDLVAGGCDEPVPARLVTVHSVDGERVIGSELGDCPNRCHAALDTSNGSGGSVATGGCTSNPVGTPTAPESPSEDPLHTAIECVLLDHSDELDGESVDANLAELAYCYRQRTGWTVEQETAQAPESPESEETTDGD